MTKQLNRKVYIGDFIDGYQLMGGDAGVGKRNPLQTLEFVVKINASAVFILRDFDRF